MGRKNAGIGRRLGACGLFGLVLGACGDSTGPGQTSGGLLVLNSVGQTLTGFVVDEETVRREGSPIDLGANFDGDALDVRDALAVSTISSFNGSQVVFVELETAERETVVFPGGDGLDSTLVNPSRATFGTDGTVWVGGRGSDAVYRVVRGDSVATPFAAGVGTFVERVMPIGDRLFAIDANIDDDGFTFQPLGPGRVVVLDAAGQPETVITLPAGVVNARDAVLASGTLIVLASGSLDPDFAPNNDGTLVTIDIIDARVSGTFALGGNGIGVELGRDGNVYVTATRDFITTEALRFDPVGERFLAGPSSPIAVRDASGSAVSCWTITAVDANRLACVTFSSEQAGRLLLTAADGSFLAEVPSGFGSTDIALR